MPFSLRAILYFVVHCIIAVVIFKILELLFVWLGNEIGFSLLVQLATWLALLVALLYFGGGWFYYGRRGTIAG